MIATVLNQGGSTKWFNSITAIYIEFRKFSKFILPMIGILPIRPVLPTIYGFFLLIVHIKPIVHDQMVQIWLRYTCLFETQLRSHLRVYKEDLNPHSLLQSPKSKGVSQKIMAGQLIQKIFSMNLLAVYSPAFSIWLVRYIRSLFIKPYKVPSMGLSTQTVWLHQLPRLITFTYTYVSCVIAGAGHH